MGGVGGIHEDVRRCVFDGTPTRDAMYLRVSAAPVAIRGLAVIGTSKITCLGALLAFRRTVWSHDIVRRRWIHHGGAAGGKWGHSNPSAGKSKKK